MTISKQQNYKCCSIREDRKDALHVNYLKRLWASFDAAAAPVVCVKFIDKSADTYLKAAAQYTHNSEWGSLLTFPFDALFWHGPENTHALVLKDTWSGLNVSQINVESPCPKAKQNQ